MGRAGLAAGTRRRCRGVLANDGEPEVRAMAAFALGLIGDAAGVEAADCRRWPTPTPGCRAAPPRPLASSVPAKAAAGADRPDGR